MRFLYIIVLFIVGFACSAFLYGGAPKLSDALLFVIAGILYKIWTQNNHKANSEEHGEH